MIRSTPILLCTAWISTGCVSLHLQPQDRLASSFSTLNLNNGGDLQSRRFSGPHQVTAQKVALKATAAPKKSVTRSAYPRGPIRVDSRQMERRRIADAALSLVGLDQIRVGKQIFPSDCSGFARAVYASRGIDIYRTKSSHAGDNGVKVIHHFTRDRRGVHRRTYPFVGDLVFFHNTYDRNGNGRDKDDPYTHVGVVDRIEDDGTVHFVHRISGGIVRQRVNLRYPDQHQRDGKIVNDFLKRRGSQRLAGQMFAQFGTVIR